MVEHLKQYWWMHGDWPLSDTKVLTTEHFEDIRKMSYIIRHRGCGHYQNNFLHGYQEAGEAEIKETSVGNGIKDSDFYQKSVWEKGALIMRTSKTRTWRTTVSPPEEIVKKGCWRTWPDIDLDGKVYEAIVNMGGEGEPVNNTEPQSSPTKWREITNPVIITYKNTKKIDCNVFYGVYNKDTIPMPDIHPEAGVWQSNTNGWAVVHDRNKYHDFDFNSITRDYRYSKFNRSGQEPIIDTINIAAHTFLPRQVISEERSRPWVYQGDLTQDFLDRAYRFQHSNKSDLEKDSVTIPNALGAVYHNNDWNHDIWPRRQYYDIHATAQTHSIYYNKKLCDSFQTVIETYASDDKLCWPVDAEYKANWKRYYGKDWSIAEGGTSYDNVTSDFWGCNGSGFELFLRELGPDYYDWYFDTSFTWTPVTISSWLSHNTTYSEAPESTPIGTWRRTWKYSMGRARNAFMRSSEMGTPEGDTAKYYVYQPLQGEERSELPFFGIHTTQMPARTEFDNSSTTVTKVSSLLVTTTVSTFKAGQMVTFGTIISGEHKDIKTVSIVKILPNGTKFNLYLSGDSGTSTAMRWNANIQARHDAIHVDCEGSSCYPKYKMKWQMLQHAFDVMSKCVYTMRPVSLNVKSTYALADSGEWNPPRAYEDNDLSDAFQSVDDELDSLTDPENDMASDDPQSGPAWFDTEGGRINCGSGVRNIERWVWYDNKWLKRYWDVADAGLISRTKCAFRLDPNQIPIGGSLDSNSEFKNSKSASIYVKWLDICGRDQSNDDNPFGGAGTTTWWWQHRDPQQPCSAGGITHGVTKNPLGNCAYDTAMNPIWKYGTLSAPINGNWVFVESGFAAFVSTEYYLESGSPVPDPDDHNPRLKEHAGSMFFGVTPHTDNIILELDFNKIKTDVFIEDDSLGRDRIGAEEPIGNPPLPDTTPPVPNPAQITERPLLSWVRKEITQGQIDDELVDINDYPEAGFYYDLMVTAKAVTGEDLGGNSPVWYKIIINPVDSETVPEDSYGDNPTCVLKLLILPEEDAIGKSYNYNATPIKLDANGDIIDTEDFETAVARWRLNVSHSGAIHTGDKVYMKVGFSQSEFTVINVADNSSFDISKTTQPAPLNTTIYDVSGYNLLDWEDNILSQSTASVIMKDDIDNEGKPSKGEAIIKASVWPLEIYIEAEFEGSRSDYLGSLE